MAKQKLSAEEKQEKRRKKLKSLYEEVADQLNLRDKDPIKQVHILVDTCDTLMNEICAMSDSIKIDDLAKVQEITSIDKRTYLDFVNICVKKDNDKLREKAIDKFEEDFGQRLLIANLRYKFLQSYMSGEPLKITDEDNEEYTPFNDFESNAFTEIMQDSAKKREYLNNVLWKQYKTYAAAAEYITNMELTYRDFKNLVDYQHYAAGGYPSEHTPSRVWSVYDRFNYTHRLLSKWKYNDTQNELLEEFGLNIKEKDPTPKAHPWDKE